MKISEFDYELPKEFIAQEPAVPRDHSRLMVVNNDCTIEHKKFYDITDYLQEGDVLVINETKVLPYKFIGKKETGGKAEMILGSRLGNKLDNNRYECRRHEHRRYKCRRHERRQHEPISYKWGMYECRIKSTKTRIGTQLIFGKAKVKVIDKAADKFVVEIDDFNELVKEGRMPLPPYIEHDENKEEEYREKYQTVYAEKEGSIAAPTAGLHFTDELLKKIAEKGVNIAKLCLHVSFATFTPLKSEDVEQHKMDKEYFEVDERNAGIINGCKGRLFAVGTTALKALESSCDGDGKIISKKGWSSLFIYPGYKFKSKTTALITNFHLPKSTLLMLVSAFAQKERIMNAYKEATGKGYRFFSFGDSMLIFKQDLERSQRVLYHIQRNVKLPACDV